MPHEESHEGYQAVDDAADYDDSKAHDKDREHPVHKTVKRGLLWSESSRSNRFRALLLLGYVISHERPIDLVGPTRTPVGLRTVRATITWEIAPIQFAQRIPAPLTSDEARRCTRRSSVGDQRNLSRSRGTIKILC